MPREFVTTLEDLPRLKNGVRWEDIETLILCHNKGDDPHPKHKPLQDVFEIRFGNAATLRLDQNGARALIAYTKLIYNNVEENIADWEEVRHAADLHETYYFSSLANQTHPSIQKLYQPLEAQIEQELTELAKHVIESKQQNRAR